MEKTKHKSKKEKPVKYIDKDKAASFITDIKTIKENLKIREILRTVKMNSSMRIKAPRGSKVMQNKDFNDNDDFFDEATSNEGSETSEPPSAMNPDVVINSSNVEEDEPVHTDEILNLNSLEEVIKDIDGTDLESRLEPNPDRDSFHKSNSLSESLTDYVETDTESIPTTPVLIEINTPENPVDNSHAKTRDRKLSLDHTLLTRREGFSQSELDLHSIGKSPLERKSSFFRKKMDSFLKNTTEIFKRQSFQSKSQCPKRRESMSVSLQSLNENNTYNGVLYQEELQGSVRSLRSSLTAERSASSLSVSQSDRLPPDVQSEEDSLVGSQPFVVVPSSSVHSLNEACVEEALLNRAISMSSGLDSAHGQGKRKASRANRVTWLASEGLTNYFRRVIQDEKSKDMQVCHSYQDFSTIREDNLYGVKSDSKGRRLSYQRAVSGEDPVTSSRYQDLSLRRKQLIPENSEANYELSNKLAEFNRTGVPPLQGFNMTDICKEACACLVWVERWENPNEVYGGLILSPNEEARQAVIRELVFTEAYYIRHLIAIVEHGKMTALCLMVSTVQSKNNADHRVTKYPSPVAAVMPACEQLNPQKRITMTGFFAIYIVVAAIASFVISRVHHVQVFIAAAHALQDDGKLLILDTERLFLNIPDILNANLSFWELSIYPMLIDSLEKRMPFNSETMGPGFYRFREIFQPYEKYVAEQPNALAYLRYLSNDSDFMIYLSWCYSHSSCNRLQLSDILVKPMQRLTKYSLLLSRLIDNTDTVLERKSLITMNNFTKTYVADINRMIRQREELDKIDILANSIDCYEVDFKDEELDRAFRMYSNLNLKGPMINCNPNISRSLIHEGDLRFKDSAKEIEVRAFLLTDMLLICKKLTKGSPYQYKLIRPKYMLNKIVMVPRARGSEASPLVFVVLDDIGSSYSAFALNEITKEPSDSVKVWEQKFREARLTYDLTLVYANSTLRDFTDLEMGPPAESSGTTATKTVIKQNSEDLNIEREARQRVAVMMFRSMGTSNEYESSTVSAPTDSMEGEHLPSVRHQSRPSTRQIMKRESTGESSRNSRLSTYQQSISQTSRDEPQPGPSGVCKPGVTLEHPITTLKADDSLTSITVNVASDESDSDTDTTAHQPIIVPVPTVVVVKQPSPYKPAIRSSSTSRNTLRVQPQSEILTLMHSLPNLILDPLPKLTQNQSSKSASEQLYQSHQELLQRKHLAIVQPHQYLSPGHRGASYPPLSPTRASLKRGLAFSHSLKNPPLSKMGHVLSQALTDPGPSTSQLFKSEKSLASEAKSEKKTKHGGGSSSGWHSKMDG